jgi:DNA-binding protein HU-beta/integration host factor subunit beta
VTKKQIVQQISDKTGLTQLQTKDIVDLTFEAIVNTLLDEGRIELRNFGVFEVKQRKARKARNPRTGEKVDVPPKNVVTFKPGKEMEEKVRKLKKVPQPSVRLHVEDVPTPPPAPNGVPPKAAAAPAKPRAAKPRKTT